MNFHLSFIHNWTDFCLDVMVVAGVSEAVLADHHWIYQ